MLGWDRLGKKSCVRMGVEKRLGLDTIENVRISSCIIGRNMMG